MDRPKKRASPEVIDLTDDYDDRSTQRPAKRARASYEKKSVNTIGASSSSSSRAPSSRPSWSSTTSATRHSVTDEDTDEEEFTEQDWRDAFSSVNDSQDFDEEEFSRRVLYGVLDTKVVGVRFYRGIATRGEAVMIRREPSNPYDSNAIRVDNVAGVQIGHIGRGVAAKLAPLMDDKSLIIQGALTGEKSYFDVPIALSLYGSAESEAQAALKERMKAQRLPVNNLAALERERKKKEKEEAAKRKAEQRRLQLKAAKGAGTVRKGNQKQLEEMEKRHNYANLNVIDGLDNEEDKDEEGPSMEEILIDSVSFDPRALAEVADKYGTSEAVLEGLPMAPQPPSIITKLLPYQRQGLAWLIDRENPEYPTAGSDDTIQLWKCNENKTFTNIATNYKTATEPTLASGGILADDMGLGKTIQILSLIVNDLQPGNPTLIVAPLSVMSNWSQQAQIHIAEDKQLKVFTYHGSNNTGLDAKTLQSYDLVITTYQTMAQEYLPNAALKPQKVPRSKGLFSFEWRRIVVDEGHNLRNARAKMSRAACALMAQSRWLLTGTPIVNSLRDLQSHVKFIRLTGGLEQPEIFSSVLVRPLKQGSAEASTLLQALMATFCLRRMKDMAFVDLRLPKLSSHKYTVQFRPHEREKYDAFEQEAQGLLAKYQTRKTKDGQNTYSHLLEVLLRMRQTCNHWQMCGSDRLESVLAAVKQNKKVKLSAENVKALQGLLQLNIDSQEDCAICLEALHNPVITACGHVFGGECIERVIEVQQKCPMCRNELKDNTDLVQPADPDMLGSDSADNDEDADGSSSSKIDALMDILRASRKSGNYTKTIIFSQWTRFLDLLEPQLQHANLEFSRLDGTMKASARDAAMARLADDESCTIMLASLGVCSVGLNLVAANQVILADSWWAPAIEDQAVDRVHRLGQNRDTTVFRLVMENSIEDRVLDIQTEKRKLMMLAFRERQMKRGNESTARLADIERLLGSA